LIFDQNDKVRPRTTKQPRLTAIVQARRFSLFGHTARISDETRCQEDLNSFCWENWRRPPGRPRTMWMKTILKNLKSNNLSMNEAIYVAENRPLWRLMSTFVATDSQWCIP